MKESNETLSKRIKEDLTKTLSKETLYKYIDSKSAFEYILKEGTLKFSNPKDFNDPFDCHEGLIHIESISREMLIDFIESSNIFGRTEVEKKFYKKNFNRILDKLGDEKSIRHLMKNTIQNFRISCFSEIPNNTLMWSHYADHHRGVAIGFNLPILHKDFVIYPVKYLNKIAPLDAKTDVLKVLYYWLTAKSHHWSYELEYRAITKDSREIIPFNREWFSEIVFGCRYNDKEIDKKVSLIRNKFRYQNFLVKKMEIDTNTFSLKEKALYRIENFKKVAL